ncbi:baseplate J/gp47 family protein [Treponema primitia]|uniref:baseplate J/gp47 family protein n=1 Tax=Treponema primitia TaxID=88058 RepID=UPI00397ECC58
MPTITPSTDELIQRNIAGFESALNVKTPPAEKSFNRTIATVEGLQGTGLYSFANDRARANLALTAAEADLMDLGENYGVYRTPAKIWEGIIRFILPDGKTLYLGTIFIGPQGIKYQTTANVIAPQGAPGSGVLAAIECAGSGPGGNLSEGDTLTIQTPIEGAARTAMVTATTALGTEQEDIEEYRQKVLDVERAEGGGGNSSDFRQWAQEVPGVFRAYPFSGPPLDIVRDPYPGERTVYVEAMPAINPDGLAPQSLLDLVKQACLAAPDGTSREILGLTADTLYVRSIVRVGIYVTVQGIAIKSGSMGAAEEAVTNAVRDLLETFSPFVQGLDADFDRRDEIVASIIGSAVQSVLDTFGGSAESVFFGTTPGSFIGRYILESNEKPKLAGITFTGATNEI